MLKFLLSLLLFSQGYCALNEKVLICGVCKNVAFAVPNTIQNIENFGNYFKDYAAIIYENNSTDNTADLLLQWAQTNPKIFVKSEIIDETSFPTREERIARARNIILSIAKEEKYRDFKYLILVDLDFTTPWPIADIANSIALPIEWDCIAANGVKNNKNKLYYDRYAFRNLSHPLGSELLGWNLFFFDVLKTWFSISKKKDLIPVLSAFGGLAIFKRDVITKYLYSGTVNHALTRYYERIFPKLKRNNRHVEEYFFINNIKSKTKKIPIKYATKVCCEHVPLFAAMALDGHDKFFVNPEMVMNYNFTE